MKKILTVSLVAMMAVSGARADLASTAYVDTKATTAANAAQAAAEAKVTALAEGAVATNAADIAKNAEAILANTNKFANYTTTTDMNAAIEAAKTDATYDDTEVRGLISGNANAINAIETSAYATSGITEALVGKISTNESAITTLNAGKETVGSVDNKIATATANMATDGELSEGLATKADKTEFETLQTAVNHAETGLAVTYALADAAQTAAEVTTAIDNKITGLDLANTYAAKTTTETGIQEAKDAADAANTAAGAAQSTADANAGEIASIKTEQGTQNTAIAQNKTDIATINASDVMTSGIDASKVAQIGTNTGDIAANKAGIDAINGGANGIADMLISGNPTEGAGKYALTAIVNESNVITGYKWELISR